MKYFAIIFLSFTLFACESENEEDLFPVSSVEVPVDTTGGLTVSFQTQIKPLINGNCATSGCHAPFANSPTLETYTQIEAAKTRINIRTNSSTSPMPQGGLLPQSDRDLIATWISEGAKNN